MIKEHQIEESLVKYLLELKYTYRSDITNMYALEENFKKNFGIYSKIVQITRSIMELDILEPK